MPHSVAQAQFLVTMATVQRIPHLFERHEDHLVRLAVPVHDADEAPREGRESAVLGHAEEEQLIAEGGARVRRHPRAHD
jgi:hypothetical protein